MRELDAIAAPEVVVQWCLKGFIGLTACLFLAACEQPTPAEPAGFAGLGERGEGFAAVRPETGLRFPADHGAHPDYRIEWWYLTANLEDAQGRDWGIQWTLFRQALRPQDQAAANDGWHSQQVWLGHAAVTNADNHLYAERLARGGVGHAGVSAAPFAAWIDDWQLQGEGNERLSPLHLEASGEQFAYRLNFTSEQPMVPQGNQGYSIKSAAGQASMYVSQPFYQVRGEIEWQGETFVVTGQGWLDREWSSQPLAADQDGWDWFSLHLDSGEKLMLFRLRHRDGEHYYSGTWIQADGQPQPLQPEQINMQPLRTTRVAGQDTPTSWQLQVPDIGLEVTTDAINPHSWMGTQIAYWEGPIRFSGSHTGVGYLEMTGY